MSIESVLREFVASDRPGAIVLRGGWGIGKTYFWKERIASTLLRTPWKRAYSYVSLFGINSLSELKVALAVASAEFDQAALEKRPMSRKILDRIWSSASWTSELAGYVPEVGGQLAKTIDRVAFLLVRNRTICFDDIERHGDGLALKDFLGLVSYLTDQRGCRIVVILNSGQLGDEQSVWDDYREKVFQGEITFSRSHAETVELGLSQAVGRPWHDQLSTAVVDLGISNIRLMQRAAQFVSLALDSSDRVLQQETIDRVARVVPLLVYSMHGRGEGAPPIDRVRRYGQFDGVLPGRGEDQRSPQEKAWDDLLSRYGVYLSGKLDNALLAMVETGFPDTEAVLRAFEDHEATAQARARTNEFHDAWKLYHNTVAENGAEIVREFERTWPPVSAIESAGNLDGTIRVLRALHRDDLATVFIERWVEQRSGERSSELDPREIYRFREVLDNELRDAIEHARAQTRRTISVLDAFGLLLVSPNAYPTEAIESLAAADPEAILAVIDATVDEGLTSAIKRVLHSPQGGEDWAKASRNMRVAVEVIARRSELAANRMSNWFGISPDGQNDQVRHQAEAAPDNHPT